MEKSLKRMTNTLEKIYEGSVIVSEDTAIPLWASCLSIYA
ncbi:hypothetical protein CSUI_009453, partial [Cystoisospora suis]